MPGRDVDSSGDEQKSELNVLLFLSVIKELRGKQRSNFRKCKALKGMKMRDIYLIIQTMKMRSDPSKVFRIVFAFPAGIVKLQKSRARDVFHSSCILS